jgi:predicted dienelactone hydrolase
MKMKWTMDLGRLWRAERIHSPSPLSGASFLLLMIGAIGSVGLTLRAGHGSDSRIKRSLFAIWVLSPFVALVLANMISKRWSVPARATLHFVTLLVTVGSLAIYGTGVSTMGGSSIGVPLIVVPVGSWLLTTIVPTMAAILSRRLSRFRPVRWLMKAVAAAVMLSVLGITVLLGLLLLDHNRDTTLPTPTGPFAVGRTTSVWSDADHSDPMAPKPDNRRELLAWIWYPAAHGESSQTMADYLPTTWRIAVEHQRGGVINQLFTRDLSRVRTHSISDAEVSPQQRSYPVVLMRAALAGLVSGNTSLAEDLASHGYFVVGFDAPYRSSVVVFPDGSTIERAPQNNADLLAGLEQEQLATRLVQAWSADMGFALDQLERLNATDSSGRFLGRLDMQRVGVFGHSLGGATALQVCHDDSRCKAGIDVDGAPLGTALRDGVTQPFLFLLSDHQSEPDAETRQVKANIRSIFDRLPGDRRLWIMIRGANHFGFGDDVAMLKSPLLMRVLRMVGIVNLDGRRQIAVTAHFINTFFDVYLKAAPASELKNQPQYPEVEYVY